MLASDLSLESVFAHPERATFHIELSNTEQVVLRPLRHDDVDALGKFLGELSAQTRWFSAFNSYDRAMAQTLCEAINRYDKLRFVVEIPDNKSIIGLFEFSFDVPDGDLARYAQHGVPLDKRDDCRFGPTIADAYQNRGLGSRVFPYIVKIAQRFGKRRIILWGGVLAENRRAIRFYEKQGFQPVGMFYAADGELSFDMILEIGKDRD